MNIEEQKQFYIDLWKSRKPSGMNHTSEEWDARAVSWIDEITIDGEKKERSERRVSETAAYLRSRGLLNKEDKVIDIGCGPGVFVAEFAKTAGFVTGIDISPKMCSFGKENAKAQGLSNTEFIVCDFKGEDIKERGWEKGFDLVFSSLSPAMSTYESLRRAEAMSRKYCFQSNYIRTYDPVGDMILSEATGRENRVHSRGFLSFMSMFNILYMERKNPEVSYYTEKATDILSADDGSARKIMKFMKAEEATEQLREKVKEIIAARAGKNGKLPRPMEWEYGWMLWHI